MTMIALRFSSAKDKKFIQRMARATGISTSAFIRNAATIAAMKVANAQTNIKLKRRNARQLARRG